MSKNTAPEAAGYGDVRYTLAVHIGNRIPVSGYEVPIGIRPFTSGEIDTIVAQTGNHWRKVFNVYAKLMFSLNPLAYRCWQDWRDHRLLQSASGTALMFSAPTIKTFNCAESNQAVRLITGRTWAESLGLGISFEQLTPEFWVNDDHRVIVCPYFDYRQLSDIKIMYLVKLLKRFNPLLQ
ncbi:MAG: hypothetical protein MI864_27285 [Pseudomonadales bacterium]|nr:hypothetical protein [Oleiphilus messinensis]MCG8614232.1 hypothetical protein [Pseudomonadales bacterium]